MYFPIMCRSSRPMHYPILCWSSRSMSYLSMCRTGLCFIPSYVVHMGLCPGQSYVVFFLGLWRLQKLYNHIQGQAFSRVLDAFRIRDVDSSYDLLRHLDYKDEEDSLRRIVLDLSSTSAYQKILTQVTLVHDSHT